MTMRIGHRFEREAEMANLTGTGIKDVLSGGVMR
jgi:hypothetical protein